MYTWTLRDYGSIHRPATVLPDSVPVLIVSFLTQKLYLTDVHLQMKKIELAMADNFFHVSTFLGSIDIQIHEPTGNISH